MEMELELELDASDSAPPAVLLDPHANIYLPRMLPHYVGVYD
jgi:hypothetical protein